MSEAKALAIERIKREMEYEYESFEQLPDGLLKRMTARDFVVDACRVLIAEEDL